MPTFNYKAQVTQLQTFFTTRATEAGQVSRCQQRASKLTAATLAQTWILGLLARPTASLEQLAQTSQQLGVSITRQGLDARLSGHTVMYFALLFAASLERFRQQQRLPLAIFAPFSAVRIIDSTQISLPAAFEHLFAGSSSGYPSLKLQLCLEYLRGQLEALDWSAGRQPDQRSPLPLLGAQAGSLLLFDLGYFNQTTVATIHQQAAYFVCRLHSQVALYTDSGTRLDLGAYLAAQTDPLLEFSAWLGANARCPVRVIARRVSPDQAQQRRRQANQRARKKQKPYSAAYLALLDWELWVTNVPLAWLATADVSTVYGLRWQVELCFKAWKSLLHLADLGHWRVERVLCHLYARLIGIVLFHWALTPAWRATNPPLSLPKAIPIFQAAIPALLRCIRHAWRGCQRWWRVLWDDCLRFARPDKRRQTPSTYTRLALLKP
jgi:DDE family transposase